MKSVLLAILLMPAMVMAQTFPLSVRTTNGSAFGPTIALQTNTASVYLQPIQDNTGIFFVEAGGKVYSIFAQTGLNKMVLNAGRISLSPDETGGIIQLGSANALHNPINITRDGNTMLTHPLNFYLNDGVIVHYFTLRGETNDFGTPVIRGYSPGIDYLAETVSGASNKVFEVSSNGLFVPIGSAAAPSYTFIADTNTGMYSRGANQLAFSTDGTERGYISGGGTLVWDNGNIQGNRYFAVSSGTEAAPTLSHVSDTGSGVWRAGAGDWGFSINGSRVMRWTSTSVSIPRITGETNLANVTTVTNDILNAVVNTGRNQRFSVMVTAFTNATLTAAAKGELVYSNAATGEMTSSHFGIPAGVLAVFTVTNELVITKASPGSMFWLTNCHPVPGTCLITYE